MDSRHKDSAKAYQVNLLDLLLPTMLDLSHITAWKDQQTAVKEGIPISLFNVLKSCQSFPTIVSSLYRELPRKCPTILLVLTCIQLVESNQESTDMSFL